MCTMIGYRFLSCSSPPFLLVFLSKCKRQTCRCIHNYLDILILSTNNSCATSARPVIFVIVIPREIVARARASALASCSLYIRNVHTKKIGPSSADGSVSLERCRGVKCNTTLPTTVAHNYARSVPSCSYLLY